MLPEWIAESVNEWFDKDYRATFYERIDYLLEAEAAYEDLPYALRYGKTFAHILERISVFIKPDEKIVGSVKEIVPSEQQKDLVEQMSQAWWDIPLEQRHEQAVFYYSWGWLRRRPPYFMSMGHLALDWEGIITRGLGDFERRAAEIAAQPEMQGDTQKAAFLDGATLCYQALSDYIGRYAEAAREAARQASTGERKAELAAMADSLEHLTIGPARSFHEALQLIWLVVLPLMKVAGCGVFNLSHMDAYLLPFYRRDIESGNLTRQQALELIEEFYLKNNEIMSPVDHMSQETETTSYTCEVTYDDPNYIILAGLRPGDQPGVNELSHLFIEAAHAMRLRNPFIVVRHYPGIEQDFWLKVVDAMRDNATIVVYNDQTMIPALLSVGVDKEDVYDYGFYGCNDPNVPALVGGLRQVWFNMLRPMEHVLHRGDYPLQPRGGAELPETQYHIEDRMIGLMTGPYYGIDSGDLDGMTGIEDVLEVYRQQTRFLFEDYRRAFEADFAVELDCNAGRLRIEDCFLKGTIENGTTWVNGGTKYHMVTFQGSGLASVVDSLAAIEQLVFRDKEMSLKEFAAVLWDDFAGHEDLRSRLVRRMPKFGNDIEWVDDLAGCVSDIFVDELARVNGPRYLYQFYPVLKTDRDFTTMGCFVGATPDGRRAGQQISENQSPTEGADMNGLTALLNSAAAIPFERITGGPLNLKIHPSAIKGENGLRMFASALETYFNRGGIQVQINVVSKEQLLDAQLHPEKHKNLCVRVTGYSAYFVQMGRKAQDEMIKRTEKAG